MNLALVVALCLLSSATAQKTSSRNGATGSRVQTDCACNGETMDCSSRGKTTFSRNERCGNSITTLILFNNSISTLPRDAFSSLTELTDLYLNDNRLSELSRNTFSGLFKLSILLLHSNQLASLPDGIFQNLRNLTQISLYGNKFQTIPNGLFAGLVTLTGVSLSDNQLTTLPADTFSGITTMELIDLSRNEITHLPRGLFRGMHSVRFLDLSGNRLTQISSQDLIGIRLMFRLDLSANRIISIPQYDASWPEITFSFFGQNNIRTISEQVFRSWLGNGNSTRLLSMEGLNSYDIFLPPADLKWVVSDNVVRTQVSPNNCKCGKIILGNAAVALCVDVECGSGAAHADWVSAVRALNGGSHGRGGGATRPSNSRGNTKG